MANDNPFVKSQKIFDDTVTLAGGKVYSSEITNYKRGGFRIGSESNQGSGDIEATFELEDWDSELGWQPVPLAGFEKHPDGSAQKTTDTFVNTQSEKYRVSIDPTGGTSGPVKIMVSMQTEE